MQLQPVSRMMPIAAAVTGTRGRVPEDAAGTADWGLQRPRLLIRRLGQDGRAALARHLIGLPAEDRRARFGGLPTDEAIRRHCDGLDLEETVCFAAVGEAGEVAGAALGFGCGAAGGDRRPRRVEVAVSVAPEHRRRGLGADLVARVCGVAAARGAEAAAFEFDPCNAGIRGLVRHFGAWLAPHADSCVIHFSPPH